MHLAYTCGGGELSRCHIFSLLLENFSLNSFSVLKIISVIVLQLSQSLTGINIFSLTSSSINRSIITFWSGQTANVIIQLHGPLRVGRKLGVISNNVGEKLRIKMFPDADWRSEKTEQRLHRAEDCSK